MDKITIKGARVHNLKNIDLEIPREKLVVITGVSGSGKSSLAFDTIYAEGERRYVESLSAYARQFLEQMEKPDVDSIEGLSPAIAIEQKTTGRNPRSTVGTVTEIYDFLRLLFSRVGVPHCHQCGKIIANTTIREMVDRVFNEGLARQAKIQILSPIVRGRKGEYRKELEGLRKDGYTKVRIDGHLRSLEEIPVLDKKKKHSIDVMVDRITVREGIRTRLAESFEIASALSGGIIKTEYEGNEAELFNEKLSCADCGISYPEITPAFFSFNSPQGACPECSGLGEKPYFDPELVVDKNLSLGKGAILPWAKRSGKKGLSWGEHAINSLAEHYKFDPSLPFKKLPKEARDAILNGSKGEKIRFEYSRGKKLYSFTEPFEGVMNYLETKRASADSEDALMELERYMNSQPCPLCKGARLKKESLHVKVGKKSINNVAGMPVKEAIEFFKNIKLDPVKEEIARRIIKEIRERLAFLSNVGLDYLTLERKAKTLSGGEGQRIRLATQIGSGLTGVLYVLDEPSIGLHQRDNRRLLDSLKRLRDLGNTVIVVEHDEATTRTADFIVDMGPGAGTAGGEVVAKGTLSEICENPASITGKYLTGELSIPIPKERKKSDGRHILLKGLKENNLKNIDVKIPIGLITCVTGVSGSGKSTLVMDTLFANLARRIYGSKEKAGKLDSIKGLEHIDKVVSIDQSPIGRTPRSNPATYTGVFTEIRTLFSMLLESRARGYGTGRFSFNVKGGRCETCAGAGVIKVEMHFLPDVYVHCDACDGARYERETLEVRYKGKNISECLDMSVGEALEFFENIPYIKEKLSVLNNVGLGYIKLGQQATTLSGGEAQRIKLSKELSKRATGKTLYILDEPTTGLHFADIRMLLTVLKSLRDAGNTIIIIEHTLDVIKFADFLIDLGPEGGDAGGRIVAEGTPEEVAMVKASHTGRFLREILKGV